MRPRPTIVLALVLLTESTQAAAVGQQRPCEMAPGEPGPSRDLYCLELVPAPGIEGVSGQVELGRPPGPFTVPAARDGRLVYAPTALLEGLPEPAALGNFAAYVAWAAPPVMSPVQRLGAVRNGVTALAAIALNQFVFLVTAEASAEVNEPQGRIVLRGQSASSRMQPADFYQYSLGAVREAPGAPDEHGHGNARWPAAPMPPGLSMLPAETALRPGLAPYLPSPVEPPPARPRELVGLQDGDTLRLEAGLVRRTIRGREYPMYGFNVQYPGPLLWVPQGARVVVDFANHLDQPTTVHWHGVRLENRSDGVPDVTQPAVPPGGRYEYRLRFPDAGVYWYHPHVREDVQQDLGLYGNLLVRPPQGGYWSPVHREEVLMLDDLLVGQDGLIPYGREGATHALMGRFGNVFLVNGEPEWRLRVRRGEVVRFYLTNVSNTRTFNVSFGGAPVKVVGSDVGNFERETRVESVVIAPAERYVVHVRFPEPGEVALVNAVQGIDHLYGRFVPETDTLGTITVGEEPAEPDLGASFTTLREDSGAVSAIDPYRPHFARPPDHTLVLAIEARDLPFITRQLMRLDSIYFHPVEWSGTMPMMNYAATGRQLRWILRDPATGRENMDVEWRFRVGQVVKIRLVNARESLHAMQHPIHLHGQRFLVLAQDGVPTENLVWKDTVLLPAGSAVDILLELSNPGRWMLHCHIAEHIEAGMMMTFTVEE